MDMQVGSEQSPCLRKIAVMMRSFVPGGQHQGAESAWIPCESSTKL
jgi:hypothetical protein